LGRREAGLPGASTAQAATQGIPRSQTHLHLLGGWRLLNGPTTVKVQPAAQRLIARVGLAGRMHRHVLAGTLWPDSPEAHARSSMRSTMWRLQHVAPGLLVDDDDDLCLSPVVDLDVNLMVDAARALLLPTGGLSESMLLLPHVGELLPGWYDDWVIVERERIRELRLHALEVLTMRLIERRRFAEAVDAGLAAVASDPLRESAHRAVVRAYLAEGNPAAALRQHHRYRTVLREELDLDPSPAMLELVRQARQRSH
jgi:DNA-binding SARP family transcriptional activator